jgi:hypothetical protein
LLVRDPGNSRTTFSYQLCILALFCALMISELLELDFFVQSPLLTLNIIMRVRTAQISHAQAMFSAHFTQIVTILLLFNHSLMMLISFVDNDLFSASHGCGGTD